MGYRDLFFKDFKEMYIDNTFSYLPLWFNLQKEDDNGIYFLLHIDMLVLSRSGYGHSLIRTAINNQEELKQVKDYLVACRDLLSKHINSDLSDNLLNLDLVGEEIKYTE